MKLLVTMVFAILFPALGSAGVAGDWAGVLNFARGPLHIVLHVTGPDTELHATSDSPDQNGYGMGVTSITLSGPTLQFTIPYLDVKFSGDVNSNGTIVGTFSQHGTAVPLVLGRTGASPRPASAAQPAGVLQGSHYHHNLTGVEFDLPDGWLVGHTGPRDGDPTEMTVLEAPGKAIFISAFMNKIETPPENISTALQRALPVLIARRNGETGVGAPHLAQNYKIRDGSVEETLIGGQKALRAIGEYRQGNRTITELLTWIYTEHTRTYFFAKMLSDNVPAIQPPFEKMLQSARIP